MRVEQDRIKLIFLEAVEKHASDAWGSYLTKACDNNVALRREVEILLDAHKRLGTFLEQGAVEAGPTVEQPLDEKLGTHIGPYKILQQIGEGGMGVVYMAEQTVPVRRRVALKVIKPGMDSNQITARFEAERQALSMMDHVNIARVLDAGATENGRPYFVMELVHGLPITKYCDDNHLTPRERLELFVPVCQAIQHAHQKGIIHRDIKPSNVMITLYDGQPVPKVIDFGVAKATEQKLTERTLFTQYGTMVGTLEYMSPEQAEMSALGVDTRSDIYSLGVLLYELLTGSTPLSRERMKKAALADILRLIKEEEPPKPSTRLSASGAALASISAQRRMEPTQLTKLMRGELDWILMKTLEKDRNRRYETANGFAADLLRFLSDEAVLACPPSAVYLLRKFLRRNKGLVVAASLIMVVLLAGTISTIWGLVQAGKGLEQAEKARDAEVAQRVEAVGNLYDSLLGEARALRLARNTGYRQQAWHRLRQAAVLETPKFNQDQLRMEAAASLGDFVGLSPTIFEDFGDSIIRTIALHPNAPQLVLGSADGTLVIRHLPDGKEICRWTVHPEASIEAIAFDAQGKFLASLTADGTVTLWQTAEGGLLTKKWSKAIGKTKDSVNKTMTLIFTPDATQLVASSQGDSAIHFMSTADGAETNRFVATDRLSGCIALSPDGTLLAAGSTDKGEHGLTVWETSNGEKIQAFPSELEEVCAVTFSPDGKLLAWGCEAGVAVCDTMNFQRRLFFRGSYSYAIAFSSDSQLLAFGNQGATKLWDIVSNRLIATLWHPMTKRDSGNTGFVYALVPSSDSRTFASASFTSIVLWDMGIASEKRLLMRFAGGVTGVTFSPQGNLLASVSKDRNVMLWNPKTGDPVRSLVGCQGAVQALAFSPDGRWLATGDWSMRESIRIWDVDTGKCRIAIDPKLNHVMSVTFSSDGKYLAVGGTIGACVWKLSKDATSGDIQLEPNPHSRITTQRIGSLCFTPDSSLLAWVEEGLSFHLWDLAKGREVPPPVSKLDHYILSISHDFSDLKGEQQGKWLALALNENEIWDMATGKKSGQVAYPLEFQALPNEFKLGWCHAISPDRSQLAVGQPDGSLELWDLTKVRERLEEVGLGWDSARQSSGFQDKRK